MADKTGIVAHGDLAEASHMANLSRAEACPVNLNAIAERHNFPMVDVMSKDGIDSVKGYGEAQHIVDHLFDLQASTKWGSSRTLGARDRAAKGIDHHREKIQDHDGWPKDLDAKAGVDKIVSYLRDKSRVAAPDKKAEEAKALVEKQVPEAPEAWGVNMKAADLGKAIIARIADLKTRIIGVGKDHAELVEHGEQSVRQAPATGAAASASNLERLAAPQPEPASGGFGAAPEPASSPSHQPAAPIAPPASPGANPGGFGPAGGPPR